VEADCRLRHIALWNSLRIGELADAVKCRHLSSAAESLVSRIRKFAVDVEQDLLFDHHDLLRALEQALDFLHQQSGGLV